MKNWTIRRKLSFWTHLIYVLIPTGAALVAAVNFWTFVFGEWYFSLPLIASLEVVAAIGFAFRLAKIDSPFVLARHFIPLFSVATLAYELGSWLMTKHDPVVGGLLTAFIVGVFGTLFVKSFGVLERLIIDPVQAAEEKAHEQAQAILVPVAEHRARARVYREFTAQLREAELPIGQEARPGLPFSLSGGSDDRIQLDTRGWGFWDESDTHFHDGYSTRAGAEEGMREYAARLEGSSPHIGSSLDSFLVQEFGIEGLDATRARAATKPFRDTVAERAERDPEFAAALAADEMTQIGQAIGQYGTQPVTEAHSCSGLPLTEFCEQCYVKWEDAESGRGPAVGAPEAGPPEAAPVDHTWVCSGGCGYAGTNGSKGVASKWSKARGLLPALYCVECRKERG